MSELDKVSKQIAELDLKIEEKTKELDKLKTDRTVLVKSVRNQIKENLKEQAEKYGFVIRNKTKPKKKVVEVKAEE